MVYQGSKAKLRPFILPLIQKKIDTMGATLYIEPFVGGANMIDHIRCKARIGSDINSDLIALLRYMQEDPQINMAPKNVTKDDYCSIRKQWQEKSKAHSSEYYVLIGYMASYGGRYFDGGFGSGGKGRNIYKERLRNARKQAPCLKGIYFTSRSFEAWEDVENAVFYMDPPYRETTSYLKADFDHDSFYRFCRKIAERNHVFISEFSMPDDFKCIWSKERKIKQDFYKGSATEVTEKLFFKSGLSAN